MEHIHEAFAHVNNEGRRQALEDFRYFLLHLRHEELDCWEEGSVCWFIDHTLLPEIDTRLAALDK